MIPTLLTLLLLGGCGSSEPAPPTPSPPAGPKMNFPLPPPPTDPLPVVDTWEEVRAQHNRWVELQGILVQRPGGKTPDAILYTYIQLADGTLVGIGERLPETWAPMLGQKIAFEGIQTDCLHREVSQRAMGPYIDEWTAPRVLDPAPTPASEEVVRAAQSRLFEDCRRGGATRGD